MNLLEEIAIACPYCGENITVLIDCSLDEQSYVEDCQVCCQPILLNVQVGNDNHVSVNAVAENS